MVPTSLSQLHFWTWKVTYPFKEGNKGHGNGLKGMQWPHIETSLCKYKKETRYKMKAKPSPFKVNSSTHSSINWEIFNQEGDIQSSKKYITYI